MKITVRKLKAMEACKEAVEWVSTQSDKAPQALLKALINEKQPLEWGNWFLSRILSHENKIRYAVYAASQVLHIYEQKHPNNKRPRKAIAAAKRYLKAPNEQNKKAADVYAYAAYAAAAAAAYAAAAAAAYAAAAAAYADVYAAAAAAAYAAAAAAAYAAAAAAAYADVYAAAAAKKNLQIKILKYGLRLLKKQNQ